MDRVRFGRALGYGARHAAKTLAQAVDAATTPSAANRSATPARPVDPRLPSSPPRQDVRQDIADVGRSVLQAHQTVQQAKSQVGSRVRGAAKLAGKSALAPVTKFTSVLWLEVTGTFFALVAAAMAEAVWRQRSAWKLPPQSNERLRLYGTLILAALFVYFAASNFVRASRRQKQ